jgi:hypothetical protein
MKLLGIISVGFDVTDQLLIRFSVFVRYWRKKWEYNETVHQLFIDFKKAYEFEIEIEIEIKNHKSDSLNEIPQNRNVLVTFPFLYRRERVVKMSII